MPAGVENGCHEAAPVRTHYFMRLLLPETVVLDSVAVSAKRIVRGG